VALSSSATGDDELGIRLLQDLRSVFASEGRDSIRSSILVEKLIAIDEAPWATLSNNKPLSTHRLARLLSAFDIRPRRVESGSEYHKHDFEQAWERYCPTP